MALQILLLTLYSSCTLNKFSKLMFTVIISVKAPPISSSISYIVLYRNLQKIKRSILAKLQNYDLGETACVCFITFYYISTFISFKIPYFSSNSYHFARAGETMVIKKKWVILYHPAWMACKCRNATFVHLSHHDCSCFVLFQSLIAFFTISPFKFNNCGSKRLNNYNGNYG